MAEVNPAFIQSIEHRPKNPTIIEAEEIPVIDISSITSLDHLSNNNIIDDIITNIGNASEKWGFFQVINHGIRHEKLENMKLAARKFFSLAVEEKKNVAKDEDNPMGYHDTELTKNVRDWKQVFDYTTKDGCTPIPVSPDDLQAVKPVTNRWPQHPPEFREVAEEYAKEVEKLASIMLELIARSLGLAGNRFSELFKDQTTSFIRLNYYPPCPSPHLALGVGRHKDAGGLTILAQDDDVEGLEVRRKTDGEWIRVKPIHGALIINVGDLIQVWSNDKYESVEHRVIVNSEKDRLSIVFFYNPAHYVTVKPLEELINDQNVAKYKEFNWGAFLMTRKNTNFKKLNVENLQISHYKI
ncbi:jasmonate-induced oxygenase 2 [Beta vulgaris subsp. vulgaris]|uniref:jasmonate-induced oxygenase 2 n=1 Tax=Beta vulgaris subsp. vulgaris TaxID=3555 RepID=UPI0020369B7D|nr:jasmonate-induced oxygenase 2 [Beta vulgaris subsp. vulgaris]